MVKKIFFLFSVFLLFPALAEGSSAENSGVVLPIEPPEDIYIDYVEETEAMVSWSAVPGAVEYSVWVNGKRWSSGTSTWASIWGLQPDTEYVIYVTATNESGDTSGPATTIFFTPAAEIDTGPGEPAEADPLEKEEPEALHDPFTDAPQYPIYEASVIPDPPDEVMVSRIEDRSVAITWTPVPGADLYSVWINETRWISSTLPAVNIEGLEPHTDYTVSVTAANNIGESDLSPVVQFITLPPQPVQLAAPKLIKTWSTGATIQWQSLHAEQYAQQYRVYVDGQPVADVTPQAGLQTLDLFDLLPGVHVVQMSGVNENREGEISAPLKFTVQSIPAPAGYKMANRSWDKILVAWDGDSAAEGYNIYCNGVLLASTSETSYLLENLAANSEYIVTLSALHPGGTESEYVDLQVETLPKRDFTLGLLMSTLYDFAPNMIPSVIILFATGGVFIMATTGKYILSRRYWRFY